MKHLFIEGPIQIGKSSLLRKCLKPYQDKLGGFSSQRLMSNQISNTRKRVMAYAITNAQDFSLEKNFHSSAKGIFQLKSSNGSKKYPQVFKKYGLSLLEKSSDYPLILLDEIGGAELLVPEFQTKIYEILSEDTPCIGVIKLHEKAEFMSKNAQYPASISQLNQQLRQDIIEKFNGEIITLAANNSSSYSQNRMTENWEKTEETINKFLNDIFTTNF